MTRAKRSLFLVFVAAVIIAAFGAGALVRPRLESLFAKTPDLSIHESRRNVEQWKYTPLQVLSAEWKFTGEVEGPPGKEGLAWAWKLEFLNASRWGMPLPLPLPKLGGCSVTVRKFELVDREGFVVAAGAPTEEAVTVGVGRVAGAQGKGHMPRPVEMKHSPLTVRWAFDQTCPETLPRFGQAKITAIVEQEPRQARAQQSTERAWLGPVTKVQADYVPTARYVAESQLDEIRRKRLARGAGKPKEGTHEWFEEVMAEAEVKRKPEPIEIQFPRGAKVAMGEEVLIYGVERIADSAGERIVGFAFRENGSSIPLRWYNAPVGGRPRRTR